MGIKYWTVNSVVIYILCREEPNVFLGPDAEEGKQQSFALCPVLISVPEAVPQVLGCSITPRGRDVESCSAVPMDLLVQVQAEGAIL